MRGHFFSLFLYLGATVGAIPVAAVAVSHLEHVAAAQTVPAQVPPVPGVAVGDPVTELTALRREVSKLKSLSDPATEHQQKVLAVAAIIAALLKLLMSVLVRVEMLTDKGKDWIPGLVTGIGALLVILTHYLAGEDWMSSFLIGGAGPGAIVIHEGQLMLAKLSTWWKSRGEAQQVATQLAIQKAVAAHLEQTGVVPVQVVAAAVVQPAPPA